MDLPCLPENFDARMKTAEEVAQLFDADPRTQRIARWIRMSYHWEKAAYDIRVAIADAERTESRMRDDEVRWPDMEKIESRKT